MFFAIALSTFLSAAPPASAQTMSTDALLASPAAQAYQAGRFEVALRGWEALEVRYPDDITIKRLKGMTLFNLERYSAAVNTFSGVVALDPRNASAQFWLGAALFKSGRVADSYAAFQRAVSLAPDSPYGLQSAKFIAAIDEQVQSHKLFSIDLTGGVQYDDNISLVNTSKIEGYRFFEQVDARYYLLRKPGWFVSVFGNGYFSQNKSGDIDEFGNRAGDFNLASGTGGVDLRHETGLLGIPVAPGINYAYNRVYEDNSRFSDIHTLTASLEANPTANTVTRIYNRFNWDFFVLDSLDPPLFSRDGTRNAAGIEQYVYFDQSRHYVWGGYEYVVTWADGSNFDSRADKWSGGISFSLTDKTVLSGTAQYLYTRYINYLGTPQRRSAMQTYSAGLAQTLAKDLVAKVGYSYSFDDSNIAAFESKRNIVTLSITRSFATGQP